VKRNEKSNAEWAGRGADFGTLCTRMPGCAPPGISESAINANPSLPNLPSAALSFQEKLSAFWLERLRVFLKCRQEGFGGGGAAFDSIIMIIGRKKGRND